MTEDGKQESFMVDGLSKATVKPESTGCLPYPAPHRPWVPGERFSMLLPDSNGEYISCNQEDAIYTRASSAPREPACMRVEKSFTDKLEGPTVYTDTPTLDISLQSKESSSQYIHDPEAIVRSTPGPCSLEAPMPCLARNAATLEEKLGSPNDVRSVDAYETVRISDHACPFAHVCGPSTERSTASSAKCKETSLHYGNARIHAVTIGAARDPGDSTLSRTDGAVVSEVNSLVPSVVSVFDLSPEKESELATGATRKVNIVAGNELPTPGDPSPYTPSAPQPPDDSADSGQDAMAIILRLSPDGMPVVETARMAECIVNKDSAPCLEEPVAMLSPQVQFILPQVVVQDCSDSGLGRNTIMTQPLSESCADGNTPSTSTLSSCRQHTSSTNTPIEDNVEESTRKNSALDMDTSRTSDDFAVVAEAVPVVLYEGTRVCIEQSDRKMKTSEIHITHELTDAGSVLCPIYPATLSGTIRASCPSTDQDSLTDQPSQESSHTSPGITSLMGSDADTEMQPSLVSCSQVDNTVQDPCAYSATESYNNLVLRHSTDAPYAWTPTLGDDAEREDGASLISNDNSTSGPFTSATDTLAAAVLPSNDSSPSARNEHKATSVPIHHSLSLDLSYDHEPTGIQASSTSMAILASTGLGKESRLVSRSLSGFESTRQPDSKLMTASQITAAPAVSEGTGSDAPGSISDDFNAHVPVQHSSGHRISALSCFIDNSRDFDMSMLEEQTASSLEPPSPPAHTVSQHVVGMPLPSEKADLAPTRSPSPLFSGRSSPCDVATSDSDANILELPMQTTNEETDGGMIVNPVVVPSPGTLVEPLLDLCCSNTLEDGACLPAVSVDICSETADLAATDLIYSQASGRVEEKHKLTATQQDMTIGQGEIIDVPQDQNNSGSQKQVISGFRNAPCSQFTDMDGDTRLSVPLDESMADKPQKEHSEIDIDGPRPPYLPPSSLPCSQTSDIAILARSNPENEGITGGRNGVWSSAEPSVCEEVHFSLPAICAEDFEEYPLPSSSFPSSSQVQTSSPDRVFSSPPPEVHVSPLSSPALHAYDDGKDMEADIEMRLDDTLPNTDDTTVSLGKRSWSETGIAESTGENRYAKKAKDVRRSPSPSPPQPIRPTAAGLKQQFKKLTRPFRSPVMKAADILSGKEGIYASAHVRPSLLRNTGLSTVQLEFKREDPKQGEKTIVPEAYAPNPNKHYTAKAAKQFRPPFSAPKDGSSGSSNFTFSSVKPTTTIQSLQAKLQKLKQAIKIKNEEGDEGEDRLEELVMKWRSIGREVAWLVWDTVKDLNPGEGLSTDRWDDGVKHKGDIDGIDRGWGWDDKEQPTANSATDEKDQPAQPYTLGTMLRYLGIDPDTLGWDEDEGDFVGDS